MKIINSVLLLLLSGFCAALFAQPGTSDHKKPTPPKGYEIGDKAGDFSLMNIDGEFYSLAGVDNAKGYIVVFTSNVCPFALLYEDRIIDLHNDLSSKGYPVIAINSNDASVEVGDSYDEMKTRATEKEFPFLYLDDKDQSVYPRFGATKTPHVFLLDKDFIVQYIGAVDDNAHAPEEVEVQFVRNAIQALENNETPDPQTTKAIGCPIKTKSSAKNGKGKRKGPPSPAKTMERMDKDKDGKISMDEAHGPLKEDFKNLDKDSDGFLTLGELAELKKKKRP